MGDQGNSIRTGFQDYLLTYNTPNSRKAQSYIRALELVQEALRLHPEAAGTSADLYTLDAEALEAMRDMVLRQRTLPRLGIFAELKAKSYLEKNFCTAALAALIRYRRLEDSVAATVGSGASGHAVADVLGKLGAAGENVSRTVTVRRNQFVFRRMMLRLYKGRCAVSGLAVPELLRASHISPWAKDEANRLNPENGLCLSALYDAAFDRCLISFDDDYRMILSPALLRRAGDEAFEKAFLAYEGQQINLPECFLPSQKFLSQHRKMLVGG